MRFKSMEVSDHEKVYSFWQDNYKISDRDDYQHIKIFLDKNPGLSVIALDDNNQVIGTVLASFDGRKGYIQKLVIKKNVRGKSLGKELLDTGIEKLKSAGALDIRVSCREELVPFYEKVGFKTKNIVNLQIKDY